MTGLIEYLENSNGRRLWPYEDVCLTRPLVPSSRALESLVEEVLGSVFFERDLKTRWSEVAAEWLISASSQHLACRSHQVYRALRPPLTQGCTSSLLLGLHKCLDRGSPAALQVALEVLQSLQALASAHHGEELALHPQLLLACLPLLNMSQVPLFAVVAELFGRVVGSMALNDPVVQNVLMVSCPSGGGAVRRTARASWPKVRCMVLCLKKGVHLMHENARGVGEICKKYVYMVVSV